MEQYFWGEKNDDTLDLTREMALCDGEFRPYMFWLGNEAAELSWERRPSPYDQWLQMKSYSINPQFYDQMMMQGSMFGQPHFFPAGACMSVLPGWLPGR